MFLYLHCSLEIACTNPLHNTESLCMPHCAYQRQGVVEAMAEAELVGAKNPSAAALFLRHHDSMLRRTRLQGTGLRVLVPRSKRDASFFP